MNSLMGQLTQNGVPKLSGMYADPASHIVRQQLTPTANMPYTSSTQSSFAMPQSILPLLHVEDLASHVSYGGVNLDQAQSV